MGHQVQVAGTGMAVSSSPVACPPGKPHGSDPTKPISLVDAKGNPVRNWKGKPVYRPDDGQDPQFFINQGQSMAGPFDPLSIADLALFNRGAAWDEQRKLGINYPEFVDYATIVIGLYAAAALMPEPPVLEIQELTAQGSHYAQSTEFARPMYPHLPWSNVHNTDLGYQLYQIGAFCQP